MTPPPFASRHLKTFISSAIAACPTQDANVAISGKSCSIGRTLGLFNSDFMNLAVLWRWGSRALWNEIDAGGDEGEQDQRGIEPAQVKAAGGHRLVEQIAQSGAKRPRENEREPEEQRVRNTGPEVQRCYNA